MKVFFVLFFIWNFFVSIEISELKDGFDDLQIKYFDLLKKINKDKKEEK